MYVITMLCHCEESLRCQKNKGGHILKDIIRKQKRSNLTLAVVLLAIGLFASTAAFAALQDEKASGAGVDDVTYIDVDGNAYQQSSVTEIDSTYFVSNPYLLDGSDGNDGWYYFTAAMNVTTVVQIDGDIKIIIKDGINVKVSFNVKNGSSLSLFAQSVGASKGSFTAYSGNTVVLNEETHFNNTAKLTGSSTIVAGVGKTYIVNGVSGLITGSNTSVSLIGGGTVDNYGSIIDNGFISSGIYTGLVESHIINRSTGYIKGGYDGIFFNGGGVVENYGLIVSDYMCAIEASSFYAVVTNYAGGVLNGGFNGIYMHDGGEIYNYGTTRGPQGITTIPSDHDAGVAYPVKVVNAGLCDGQFLMAKAANCITFMEGSSITGRFLAGNSVSINFAGDLGAALKYSTVKKSDFGTMLEVMIDVTGMPATLKVGDIITLIDSTADVFNGSPLNNTYSNKGYSFEIYVSGNQLLALVTAVPGDATYDIDVDPHFYTFPFATEGYAPQSALKITVVNIGTAPTGALMFKLTGAEPWAFMLSEDGVSDLLVENVKWLKVVPKTGLAPGTYTAIVTIGTAPGNESPMESEEVWISFTVAAKATAVEYKIKASADAGSKISPSGLSFVKRGDNITYTFSVLEGYIIAAVVIDGKDMEEYHLPQVEIKNRTFTFQHVVMDHTIEIRTVEKSTLILVIDIMKGKGYAEYSLNGSDFVKYDSMITLDRHDDLVIRAFAADGYLFKEWMLKGLKIAESEIEFHDIHNSIYLELYFSENSTILAGGDGILPGDLPWGAIGIVILVFAAGFLIWFFLFYRRYYEVEMPEGVIGAARAHRKTEYRFGVKAYKGNMEYRIGEEGEWKTAFINENGEYFIPKGQITAKVFLRKKQ